MPELHLITVANATTLPVLKHGCAMILASISANTYRVIVPEAEVPIFRDSLNSHFIVESEDEYLADLRGYISRKLPETSPRFGWYLQQFIKLSAVHRHSSSANVLIWDADTIPLRKLTFFSRSGAPKYFISNESHAPYFRSIERAMGLGSTAPYSFVAQCFPITSRHASAFFSQLSELGGGDWWTPLLESIDFSEDAGFSEYEMLGTFIYNQFPNEFGTQHRTWLRNGWMLFEEIEATGNPVRRFLWSKQFAYISFETHLARRPGLTRSQRSLQLLQVWGLNLARTRRAASRARR